MFRRRQATACTIIFGVAILAGPNLYAQVTATGNIEGNVSDTSKAVVGGAMVKLSSAASGLRRESKSNDVGSFRFDLLPAGEYGITVEMPGFATVNYRAVEVSVGQTTSLSVTLEPRNNSRAVATVSLDTTST